jgi:hypothetical protein
VAQEGAALGQGCQAAEDGEPSGSVQGDEPGQE